MGDLWVEEKSNILTRFRRKIKREKILIHSRNQEFSVSIIYPSSILNFLVFPDNSYTVTIFRNKEKIKSYKIPEHSLEYMLKKIGEEVKDYA